MEGPSWEKRGPWHEKRRDDCRGEHSYHQGGPGQGLRPVVIEEEHYHRLHRRQRLCPGSAREGGFERLSYEVSRGGRVLVAPQFMGRGIRKGTFSELKYVVRGFQNHIFTEVALDAALSRGKKSSLLTFERLLIAEEEPHSKYRVFKRLPCQ